MQLLQLLVVSNALAATEHLQRSPQLSLPLVNALTELSNVLPPLLLQPLRHNLAVAFFFSISATAAAAAGRPCGALEALRQYESHNCSDYAMQKIRHTEQHQL